MQARVEGVCKGKMGMSAIGLFKMGNLEISFLKLWFLQILFLKLRIFGNYINGFPTTCFVFVVLFSTPLYSPTTITIYATVAFFVCCFVLILEQVLYGLVADFLTFISATSSLQLVLHPHTVKILVKKKLLPKAAIKQNESFQIHTDFFIFTSQHLGKFYFSQKLNQKWFHRSGNICLCLYWPNKHDSDLNISMLANSESFCLIVYNFLS